MIEQTEDVEGDETPWGLDERETVCRTCRLAYWRALGHCPTCKAEGRTPKPKAPIEALCAPSACGSCPLAGLCGDPADLPPEPVGIPADEVDLDPAEPRPEGGCCGGGCG